MVGNRTERYVVERSFNPPCTFMLLKRFRMYEPVNAIRTSMLIAFATSNETGPIERWSIKVPPYRGKLLSTSYRSVHGV